MTLEESATAPVQRFRPRKRRRRVSVIGVLGELLITAGVLVLMFLGWQVWLNDIIVGAEQQDVAVELSEGWEQAATDKPETPDATATPDPADVASQAEPVVMAAPANADTFAVLMVPRWGEGWERPIAEGIGVTDVLNKIGIGHYPGTQMPGEVGNFAVAAHRKAYGGGLEHVHELQIGDHIYVETADGWYSYVYRSSEYVLKTAIAVIDAVPQQPDATPTDRLITLTTCNPFYSTAERLISYGVYDGWYPRAGGPPAEIAEAVSARDA
ncbi:sortase A [Glaciihabitans tibetensis]|uniref:Sortase A n=1 Tax=Glaciihabitans tibetensis TaxID=1266600 RepID=A0A2T0VCU6_9MICO|nr:class E sortase [Glaciihabitans tibetensis]PRY67954.1 sortase A [Glaciihabitans tibetensis]